VLIGAEVKAGMEVSQRDCTHAGFHDHRTTSISRGTVESLADLDDICLPMENLLYRLASVEDTNHVSVLGRIGIRGNSAKFKGDGVGLVKLEASFFGESRRTWFLGLVVSFLTDLHGGSFTKGVLVTFCGLISKCTTLKAGKLSSVVLFEIMIRLESYKN
jgi:hypothetical protein